MATKIANTAVGVVTLYQEKPERLDPVNLMRYRTSLALFRKLTEDGVFSDSEYRKIRTILTKKYGLSSDSIFAEIA